MDVSAAGSDSDDVLMFAPVVSRNHQRKLIGLPAVLPTTGGNSEICKQPVGTGKKDLGGFSAIK